MTRLSHLELPFFDAQHRALAAELDGWAAARLAGIDHHDVDRASRSLVQALGQGGFLRHGVPSARDGARPTVDLRSLVVCGETLARHDTLAAVAFALQGLGSAPLTLAGSPALQAEVLPRIARGEWIAAFALSEPEAGADVAALRCGARDDGEAWVLEGEKTWVGNGGIADVYCVFARSDVDGAEPGQPLRSTQGLSAFLVRAGTPGLEITERLSVAAPQPLARLRLSGCRVPHDHLVGQRGGGHALAMRSLALMQPAQAAAALGLARRALDAAVEHSRARTLFGRQLADFQLTQVALGEMALAIDAAALLTYRAAWRHDGSGGGDGRLSAREAAMASLSAAEQAQQVIDRAQQLHGADGVRLGSVVERLQRDIRTLRTAMGAGEEQRQTLGRDLLDL